MFKKNRPASPLDLGELPDREAFDRWAAGGRRRRHAEIKRKAGSVVGHVLAWVALYVAGLAFLAGALWLAYALYEIAKAQPLTLVGAAWIATAWLVAIRNYRSDAHEDRNAKGGRR